MFLKHFVILFCLPAHQGLNVTWVDWATLLGEALNLLFRSFSSTPNLLYSMTTIMFLIFALNTFCEFNRFSWNQNKGILFYVGTGFPCSPLVPYIWRH